MVRWVFWLCSVIHTAYSSSLDLSESPRETWAYALGFCVFFILFYLFISDVWGSVHQQGKDSNSVPSPSRGFTTYTRVFVPPLSLTTCTLLSLWVHIFPGPPLSDQLWISTRPPGSRAELIVVFLSSFTSFIYLNNAAKVSCFGSPPNSIGKGQLGCVKMLCCVGQGILWFCSQILCPSVTL